MSLQPWEWSKETPSSPWVRCVQSVCTGADNCMLIISQVLKGPRKELFPLPVGLQAWGGSSFHRDISVLLQTEQKLQRFKKNQKGSTE